MFDAGTVAATCKALKMHDWGTTWALVHRNPGSLHLDTDGISLAQEAQPCLLASKHMALTSAMRSRPLPPGPCAWKLVSRCIGEKGQKLEAPHLGRRAASARASKHSNR